MLIPTKAMQYAALVIAVIVAVLKVLIPAVPAEVSNTLAIIVGVLLAILPFVTASDATKAEAKFRLKYSLPPKK